MTNRALQKTLIVTTALILVPIIIGLVIWQQLPEKIPTHFSMNGRPNGWSSRPFTVFGIPLLMLVVQYICGLGVYFDPKKSNINQRIYKLTLWIVPVITLFVMFIIYGKALHWPISIGLMTSILIGLLFIVLGNYMYKIKQNYTIGIRVPWTLNSQENWNRTHRLAAWVFVISGLTLILNAFLQQFWLIIVVILCIIILPVGYSFLLYRKGI
ncbi:SdpI family protein [Weissella paramesenteroides]|uniref:SdpI family protein n=1 Tax=Weissella paramesenteroides TaxID=1249 RepID=UPI003982ABD4